MNPARGLGDIVRKRNKSLFGTTEHRAEGNVGQSTRPPKGTTTLPRDDVYVI